MKANEMYDIEYVSDGINHQETGLTEAEAEAREEELELEGAEEIVIIIR